MCVCYLDKMRSCNNIAVKWQLLVEAIGLSEHILNVDDLEQRCQVSRWSATPKHDCAENREWASQDRVILLHQLRVHWDGILGSDDVSSDLNADTLMITHFTKAGTILPVRIQSPCNTLSHWLVIQEPWEWFPHPSQSPRICILLAISAFRDRSLFEECKIEALSLGRLFAQCWDTI